VTRDFLVVLWSFSWLWLPFAVAGLVWLAVSRAPVMKDPDKGLGRWEK
jgi:hypothetical protein